MKKTTLFRKLMLDKEIFVIPGCHDALSAKIVELVGFKAVTMGGYAASAASLAKPDVSLLTLTEYVNIARNIVQAVDLPLFVDGDTGHGNVTNVGRTVRVFENAGVAALFIEDQVFPKRCGHMEGKQIIPTAEMVAKVKAAVDARVDEDLVIMARTDAIAVYGIDDAIERANLYREAGADLIFVEAPRSVEEMRRINTNVDAPTLAIQLEGGKTPLLTTKDLQEIGFSVVVYPNATVYATAWALKGLWETLKKEGTTRSFTDRMIGFDDFNTLVGLDKIRELESFYYRDLFESLQKKNK
ncbi:MAG: oxaloacetate decarboxylase [Deltaproteobacteria bacterium]|jgi:methylisocitrate lyase|nr:MAG: oxaloacetate decarboxylase [Deltaproteobacteria bacterium]RPJ15871.1 MAG: oxaloacetate decarboxylase [Deltaproteobacteria bacterium]